MVCEMVPGDNTPASGPSAMVRGDSRSDLERSNSVRLAAIVVRDMTTATLMVDSVNLHLASTVTVAILMEHVAAATSYRVGSFELVLQKSSHSQDQVVLNRHLDETLESAGLVCDDGLTRNSLIIGDLGRGPPSKAGREPVAGVDSLPALAAVAASKEAGAEAASPALLAGDFSPRINSFLAAKPAPRFVGLVNQAMTCYLNSLIQTLYMTPEFRNALYRWRFDGSDEEQTKSIPFQLQSLFVQLQTTDKPSIGTTDLTRSFGWDSSEAWQQHDIQELCRVMFDALEHKFKNTQQADLISRLYEGKMVDYVRCLECRTEKARQDTFLDIPLPVRPFGSQTAYASVEEALQAFVAPETLDGNNQYWCDVCAKKCDAHKGLKFSRFPYLLTLHLKRFDFDYNTLHRIKLNDKVTFPELLNVESLLRDPLPALSANNNDYSDDKRQPAAAQDVQPDADSMSEDDDEGIDVRTEGCTSTTSCDSGESAAASTSQPAQRHAASEHNYELFSIMIHSGSASGGHYYAYIKDFLSQQWYCFNDQTVSPITYDDIRRTYGGGPPRSAGYFTSAYTSSTNAYMLMYRKVDKERNATFVERNELPEHVQQLLQRMKVEEESQREEEEKEKNTCRIQLYCHHPKRGRLDLPLALHRDVTLRQATSLAYERVGDLSDVAVPLHRCRLVKYNEFYDSVDCSWDDRLDESVSDILGGIRTAYKFDLLLEIVAEGQPFQVYTPGSVSIKVLLVDVDTAELRDPFTVRLSLSNTVLQLKQAILAGAGLVGSDADRLYVALIRYSNELRLLNQDERTLRMEGFHRSDKVYAALCPTSDEVEFEAGGHKTRFYDLIDLYENAVTVHLTLPASDKETLERLGIDGGGDCLSALLPAAAGGCPSPLDRDASVSPDAASEDSLSHLERERALSEDGDDDEPASILPSDAVLDGAWPSPSAKDDGDGAGSDGSDGGVAATAAAATTTTTPPAKRLPNSTSSASASEDSSSVSLTDSDRTLLGHPPEAEENDRLSTGDADAALQVDEDVRDGDDDATSAGANRHFFKVTAQSESTVVDVGVGVGAAERKVEALVDKRMPLAQFKAHLQALLHVPAKFLLVYKKTSGSVATFGGAEREWSQSHETLETLGEDPQVVVRLGRALRQGEMRGKIYQLCLDQAAEDRAKFLFDWVLAPGDRVADVKRDIVAEVKARYGVDIALDRCVLRKKNWRTPSIVYGNDDDNMIDMMYIFKNWEMYLQVLGAGDSAANYVGVEVVVFARRWRPSDFVLDPLVNVPLVALTRRQLARKLVQLSGATVPAERIQVAKAPGAFPCEGSLLAVHDDLPWVTLLDGDDDDDSFRCPCALQNDGDVVYWRDAAEPLKKLSDAERRDIVRRENGGHDPADAAGAGGVAPAASASSCAGAAFAVKSGKERPLRIFLDEPSTGSTTTSSTVNTKDIELD